RRAGLVVSGVGLMWLVLAARLFQLQGWQHLELTQRADRQRELVQEVIPRPGDIYDARGRLLATTLRRPSLYVVPSEIDDSQSFAETLAAAVSVDAAMLCERLQRMRDKQFLWVKRRLSEDETERVRELELPTEQWAFREEFQRIYPQGRLAAHVLGLRDIDGVG